MDLLRPNILRSTTVNLVYLGATCFTVTLASAPVWIRVLAKMRVVDVPNIRSSHLRPTVRGVGLAPATGVVSAVVVAFATDFDRAAPMVILLLSIVTASLGLAEDLAGVEIWLRATIQLLLGAGGAACVCVVANASLLWILPSAIVYAAYVNVANFMDGVNGMSIFHGIVAGGYFAILGAIGDKGWLTMIGLVIATAFAGFAPWNLGRNAVFLGDVGSYLLGGLVAATAMTLVIQGESWLLACAPGLSYVTDTSMTFLKRVRMKRPAFHAHREHIYQHLQANGFGHIGSAATVAALSVLCCSISILGHIRHWSTSTVLVLLLGVLSLYVCLPLLMKVSRLGHSGGID